MSILSIHAFSAIHTVAASHRMVTEGWTLFNVIVGVKSFYIFNAHFLSVNIFQEKGGCEVCANCELFQCFLNGM